MEQKTQLYDCHAAAGGKMVPFAGYLLPIQYPAGIIAEHIAVRTKAGIFDVSHMGEVVISGPDALANLNRLFTNDFTGMSDGSVRYSLMCNERGGVVDDLLVYRQEQERFMVVVNASNRLKDVEWIKGHLSGNVRLEDISDNIALIALQGPNSTQILSKAASAELPAKYYSFIENCLVGEISCLVSRTGYTGELGYELYCAAEDATRLWDTLLIAGEDEGLVPCGLGARDTLRLEASMPLYGHELDEDISPLEAGLDFAVKMGKTDFIGKSGLSIPTTRKRVGLKVTGRGIVREHCDVFIGSEKRGFTTSGTYCPYLNGAYAMALMEGTDCEPGALAEVEVRGRLIAAEIVPLPFYSRSLYR